MKAEETAIQAVFAQLAGAWNRGDGEAYGNAFEEDADYVVFNGMHLKGRQQIAAIHQQLFDTALKGTRMPEGGGAGSLALRFLAPHVALVHTSGSLQRPGQAPDPAVPDSVQTFVLTKQAETWRIASFQNTRVQPMGPPPGAPRPGGAG